jgi:LPXTG-motif cell wall-anchored protein
VKSDEATTSLKIDTVKPVVSITGSKINDQGKLVLEFEVTDETSGVDLLGVTVNDNLNVVSRPDDSGAVTGTFTVDEDKTYTIKAKDKAGNESEPVVFVPLTLSVSPVTDITDSSAYVEAEINAGTYDIKSYYIAYKKSSSSRYTVCRTVKDETTETGVKLSCDFKNLSSDTSYDFKVYAVAETTGETKSYEGTFKTLDSSATGEVYGSAKYEDTFSEDYRTYPIYVTLTSGDSVIAGATLDADSDGKYSFKNVSDGEYQVNAVAGNYSKTARVVVSDGYVTYPESYLATGGIAFEIGGLSTSVEIQNDTGITAENLEAVFVKGYGNNDNVSDAEYKDVEAGGNILITLYAESLDTSSGEYADAIDYIDEAINDKMDGRGKPVRYYDIYLTKTYTSSTGEKTVSNISSLTEPITMFFTDESLVGKPMYVVAVSEDSLYGGFSEPDIWPKDGPSFNGIVQVDTYHCSVYAIYTDEAYVKKQYTVTWYGGDNQVLKSETVTEGDSVTAPVGVTPTKTSDVEGYHYEFVGWKGAPDIFKNITADTDIDADFKLVADSASGGSTETPDNTASGGSTEKPDNTASGGTTEKPNNTASGGTTEKPNNTASGGTTEKPNNTASGGTTEKPGSTTQSPSNTASGGTTEKPGNTSTGNNGSGSTTETPGITGSTSTGNDSSGSQNPGGNTTVGGSGNGSITEIPGASTEQPTTQSPANADGTVIIIQNPTNTSVPDTYITIPAGSDSSDTGIDVSATGTHYSYMGSSSSPKTGDSTPIAVIVVLMLTSATGLVVITRKRKEEQ